MVVEKVADASKEQRQTFARDQLIIALTKLAESF